MEFTFDEFYNLFEQCETYAFDAYDEYYAGGVNGAYFRVNGKTFLITEDPEYGYRSCLGRILNVSHNFANVFPSVNVKVIKGYRGNDDVIAFVSTVNNKHVFMFGTDHADDWYPCFICNFRPENIDKVAERKIKTVMPTSINDDTLV